MILQPRTIFEGSYLCTAYDKSRNCDILASKYKLLTRKMLNDSVLAKVSQFWYLMKNNRHGFFFTQFKLFFRKKKGSRVRQQSFRKFHNSADLWMIHQK